MKHGRQHWCSWQVHFAFFLCFSAFLRFDTTRFPQGSIKTDRPYQACTTREALLYMLYIPPLTQSHDRMKSNYIIKY
jgi:hypothetical protein